MPSPPNIMIVEDDATTAMLVDIQLRALGYRVCGVERSGEAVLASVNRHRPDLILIDVILDGTMDGVETAHALLRSGHAVPVVFLTARNDQATMERIRSSMPYGCLIKPVKQEELATAISIALRGHELEALAKRSQDEFAFILNCVSDVVIGIEMDGTITYCNTVARQLIGDARAGEQHLIIDQVLPIIGGAASWQDFIARPSHPTDPAHITVLPADQHVRSYSCRLARVTHERAHGAAFILVLTLNEQRDTDRHRLQADVRRMNRALHVLSRSARAVQQANNERFLFQEICQLSVQMGYRLAWVGLAQHNPEQTIEPVAQSGYNDHYLEEITLSWREDAIDEGPTAAAIRTGELAIARDILEDERYSDWRMEAAKRGYASGIALPLKSGDRVIGALTIYAIESDAFGTDEVNLLRELAENVSYGLMALQARSGRARIERDLLQAEARYRSLVEQLPIVTYVAEADETAARQYVSPQIAAMTGFHPEYWISNPSFFVSRLHPADRIRVIDAITACRNGAKSLACEYRLLAHDGSVVWVRDQATLADDGERNGRFIHGVMIDITKRRFAEESLHKALGTMRALIDASPLAIYTLDIDGRISEVWNQAAANLFGWTQQEVMGQQPPFVTAEKTAESRAFLARILSGEAFTDVEVQRVNAQGATIDLTIAGAPLCDPDGWVIGAIFMLADITSRKRAEAALLTSQRDATLGRMAAVVAHEVNNPLAAIKAWLGMLRSDLKLTMEMRSNVDMITAQVDRIASTVRNLLGFARQREAKEGRVPATVLIRTVAALFVGRMKARGISFHAQVPDDLPMIHGDNDQLQEVLINLLENASQALGSDRTVHLRATCRDNQLHIVVEDDGPGLGPDPERLFTPFVTTKANGTGLGLSVARRICVAHGGRLSAENIDSGGARFSVLLPSLDPMVERA